MADEVQYAGAADGTTPTHKRKYADDQAAGAMPSPIPSSGRRQTGFSAPISSTSPPDSNNNPPQPSYSSVPPPADDFQLAKQRAQEIAARLFNSSDPKRARVENGASAFDTAPIPEQKPLFSSSQIASAPSTIPVSYGGYQSTSKKIDIPNGRVGVIIGKGGETIKYLQIQSGAKIQVTRDNDADLNSPTRLVELMGTQDQIAKAEELINGVLAEAEAGGSGIVSRRITGQSGSDQFVMKVPNNKVGLIIGKGGETIKNMQTCTGARIQVIPLHLPPGDTSTERTLQIDGTSEQIEAAKQLVNEVISENRLRNPSMAGGYSQQGYQARPPTNWGSSAQQQMQPSGYGYVQPGAYPNPSPQYNMPQPAYSSYPSQPTSGGYSSSGWDQSTVPPSQQTTPGSGYDYYSQQPSQQQQQGHNGPTPTDNSGYSYNQPQAAGYHQGQGYPQDAYGGGYHAAPPQPGYGQHSSVPGYDQQGYSSAPGYGNTTNPSQDGHSASYGAQGENVQAPPPVQTPAMAQQQGYSTSQQPSPNPGAYPSQVASQQAYGMPPVSQAGYGTQPPAQTGYGPGYGPPQAQKPPTGQPYGQAQQSPSTPGAYAQSGTVQPGYSHSQQPPVQTGYAQPDSATQRAPSSYGTAASQPGYGPPAYGTAPSPYGQQPPYNGGSYGSGYSQPPAYSSDANAAPAATAAPPQPKASPQS